MFFHALTLLGPKEAEQKAVSPSVQTSLKGVNAMKQTCVNIILAYHT